jgi:choline dehydrogenase-like flavoprotein
MSAIIIGSGFGGSMAAYELMQKGYKVLLLERGDWVERSFKNWQGSSTMQLTEHFTKSGFKASPLRNLGACYCVGGPSVFYGGVSLRFREKDFAYDPKMSPDARWPISYEDIEPHYQKAEEILNVAGCDALDPTRPKRSQPFPRSPHPLSAPAQKIQEAARSLNLSPFPLPMAIDPKTCIRCATCDAYACAISAKNDLCKMVLQPLMNKGLTIKTQKLAFRLIRKGDAIEGVEVLDIPTRTLETYKADIVILAAGALETPKLLLHSDLCQVNPSSHAIGRYLMRHCNAVVFGVFNENSMQSKFHKNLAILDFYHQELDGSAKLGSIQQIMAPSAELLKNNLKWPAGNIAQLVFPYALGLLTIAEDQSRFENGIQLSKTQKDEFGIPKTIITHRHTQRDKKARNELIKKSKEILTRSGALFHLKGNLPTFSHAVGTVRMGENPKTSPLDPFGRFRGIKNLYITDGSTFSTSAGVNPSLTIAANALRICSFI